MNRDVPDSRILIADEAAEWVIRLADGELDASSTGSNMAARNKLLRWLQSSPQHIEEFLLATALWQELNTLGNSREDKDQEQLQQTIIKLVSASRQNIVPLDHTAPANTTLAKELINKPKPLRHYRKGSRRAIKPGKRNQRSLIGARYIPMVGAMLIVIIGGLFLIKPDSSYVETNHGEQRSITLTDGSVIHLNTQSAVSVIINDAKRQVNLLRGEAMFEVAKDPIRPFRVKTQAATVEAIGTEFNIYQYGRTTSITVVEGQVAIQANQPSLTKAAPHNIGTTQSIPSVENIAATKQKLILPLAKADKTLLLSAGEEIRLGKNGRLTHINSPDIEKNIAWKNRRLVFRGDTLWQVAEDFNRYNHQKIIVRLPEQFTRKITGNFHTSDPESFIAFLERDPMVLVTRRKDRFIIQPKNKK